MKDIKEYIFERQRKWRTPPSEDSSKKVNKEDFIKYIEKYGNDVSVFDLGKNKLILSFYGSDGPDINDDCLSGDGPKLYFSDPDNIDKYIQKACKGGYASGCEAPEITFKEYVEKFVK